jgi:uncharacterized membrane protein
MFIVYGAKRFARIGRAVPGTSLLPVPFAIATAVLILLAITLTLDAFAGTEGLHGWLSVGNVDDARAILGAILGAVSTVLALIFSVTLLVFSMAVSQFGPRLMPYFLRDRAMQVALGLFLATFLHSLIAFVITGQRGGVTFVPQITVLTSVVLVFVSFCYLVVYNNRIALAIQTNNVLARIVEDLNRTINELSQHAKDVVAGHPTGPATDDDTVEAVRRRCISEGCVIRATTSGYVQKLNHAHLVHVADRCAAIVCLAFRPGDFMLEGEPLAFVVPAERVRELGATVHNAVKIGQHRTLEQDVEFAFAQLSEIAIRALSPAVNDTYTGLSSIDWLGDALRMFATFPGSQDAWRNSLGKIRLFVPPLPFARVVHAAFDLIRQAGADSPAVTIRLLQTCARLAPQLSSDEQRRAIRHEVEAAHEAALRMPKVHLDRTALEEAYNLACGHLGDLASDAPVERRLAAG